MIHNIVLPVPKSTSPDLLARVEFTLPPGLLEQIFITFPDGCAGLVGTHCIIRERILYPTNPDVFFVGNNYTYSFAERLTIEGNGEDMRVEGYNADQVYEHKITWIFVVVPPDPQSLADAILIQPYSAPDVGSLNE